MTNNIENTVAKVVCRILRDKLPNVSDAIKLYFQGIHPEWIVASVKFIQSDAVLRNQVEIHLPRRVFSGAGLEEEFLTDQSVGDYRNEEPEPGKKIMLLGPPDESEWDTVRLMQPFGEQEIMEAENAWVEVFAPAFIDDTRKIWWRAALRGLNQLAFSRLNEFADFVQRTSIELNKNGLLPEALGSSLPALRLPKRTDLFSIGDKHRGQTSQWKRKFNDHKRATQCFLTKRDKSDSLIDNDILVAAVKDYREQPDHDPDVAKIFDAYVEADYGWTEASNKLAEVDWSIANPVLFERVRATKKLSLGEETLYLFDSESKLPDLTEEEKEYLQQLSVSGAKGDASVEDKAFFRRYYRELQNNPTLFSRWESYILEKSVEDTDFLNGLARCIRILRPRANGKPWKLVVKAKSEKDKDLYLINESTGTYFATRYQGITAVLQSSIQFTGMRILDYPKLLDGWKSDPKVRKKLKVSSVSREACQLVFYVEVQSDNSRQIKLIWRFNTKSVTSNMRDDIKRLSDAKNPVIQTQVLRETSGRRTIPLDLKNALCLQPVYGQTSGSLIPQTQKLKLHSIRTQLKNALDSLLQTRCITEDISGNILGIFDIFETAYKAALIAFLDKGLAAHEEITQAATSYGSLLQTAAAKGNSDTVLGTLLPILLSVSTVKVESFGGLTRPSSIVPPWHPLRLLAIISKARQFSTLAQELTSGIGSLSDADGSLFFEDTAEWLNHIYYPEIVCQLRGKQPIVLSDCGSYQDYSVHEPPVLSSTSDAPANIDPKAAASQIGTIVESYLQLQPHERDNLSVVLFDCDSEQLPNSVVDEIRALSEDEEQDATCQILLAHSDSGKLRSLYRSLACASESVDNFNTSEATREFMARLRINIMVTDNENVTTHDSHPYDIVFAESAIAHHARLKWYPVQIDSRPADQVKPSAWSRRKPMESGAISAAVYLTSPALPEPVWQYINATSFAIEPEEARRINIEQCLVPARTLGVNDESIGHLIDKMHSLGSWVVNYDELLHRKLLENKGIKVIRYKQDVTQGKNLIISSISKDSLLRSALKQLTHKLLPDIEPDVLVPLVDDLISEANAISGNLVLRAIRRTENAKELLGLVLSKYLVTNELCGHRNPGWFLLDDYASWLGEEEKQIADILCLSPSLNSDGKPVLDIVVTEAKFVEHASVAKKSKESASQLRQTLSRLERGLGNDSNSLDRHIWLSRISDMIVDGIEARAIDEFDASEWRRLVRDGQCQIQIRGYSHVFNHGAEQASAVYEITPVKDTQNGFQEIFSLNRTRAYLKSFIAKTKPDRNSPKIVCNDEIKINDANNDESIINQTEIIKNISILPSNESVNITSLPSDSISQVGDVLIQETIPDALTSCLHNYGHEQDDNNDTIDWMNETSNRARRALIGYDMPAEIVGNAILTPNSLLIKFKGSDKLTASVLERKRAELYTTHGIKVVNIRPEAGALAVSIERPERQVVQLGSVWKNWRPEVSAQGNTRIIVAVKEDDSTPLFLDPLSQSPHTLIAGTSGSGKSVLMQNILLGLAATNSPDITKIILIDPKYGVDYGPLGNLPHIQNGIITNSDTALEAIENLVIEMETRYPRLQKAGVNHVRLFNQQSDIKMPYIWLIHDEFADWMQNDDYKSQVVSLVNRLGMKARAAGIFLIFAAQRPSVEVMPMQLRDNLDNRLILRVAQEGTSMFCLGEKGAENLLPRGQMLTRLGGSQSTLCQVPFADLTELNDICNAVIARHNASKDIS